MSDNCNLKGMIESNDMITVGEWQLVEKVVDSRNNGLNSHTAKESHYESTTDISPHRNVWLHSDGKTILKVFRKSQGNFAARVHMGSGETDTVGGWTCGIHQYSNDPTTVITWAREWMDEHDSVGFLYDD